ncbi:MAG: response regulator [Candidatus Zixiibacteriota bacterium]|nr:MAG: response regulator [candidate division Zixibacteria bacterium]
MVDKEKSPKGKILVIDDDKMMASVVENVLSHEGYQIYTATDGKDGFEKATELKPDLIFMDINMPEMDGYETTMKLKSVSELESTPVIYISGLNPESEANKVFMTGGASMITKPFTNSQLIDVVKLAMGAVSKNI